MRMSGLSGAKVGGKHFFVSSMSGNRHFANRIEGHGNECYVARSVYG